MTVWGGQNSRHGEQWGPCSSKRGTVQGCRKTLTTLNVAFVEPPRQPTALLTTIASESQREEDQTMSTMEEEAAAEMAQSQDQHPFLAPILTALKAYLDHILQILR